MSETSQAFRKASDKILAAVGEAIGESARSIRDEAKRDVPVDTGELRDNIIANVDGMSAKVGVFDDEAYYGSFVEFGTSEQRAQPFLGPAAEQERTRMVKRIVKHVEEAL